MLTLDLAALAIDHKPIDSSKGKGGRPDGQQDMLIGDLLVPGIKMMNTLEITADITGNIPPDSRIHALYGPVEPVIKANYPILYYTFIT